MARREKAAQGPLQRIAHGLDLPLEGMSSLPRLELIGNRELLVEGHRGIVEYTEQCIRISGGPFVMTVTGEGLELIGMTPSSARITGRIGRLSFDC